MKFTVMQKQTQIHTHVWEQGKFVKYCTHHSCLAVKDNKTDEVKILSYSDFVENQS